MGWEHFLFFLFYPFISAFPMSLFVFEQHVLNFSVLEVWGFSCLSFVAALLSCSSIKLQVLVQDFI